MATILIDNATIKSSLRALGQSALNNENRELFDIDIANLASLIENIVLFDKINYISSSDKLDITPLGDALVQLDVPDELSSFCSNNAQNWINSTTTVSEILNAIGLIPKAFWTELIDGTVKYLVFQGLGVKGKYSDLMQRIYSHSGLNEQTIRENMNQYETGCLFPGEERTSKGLNTDTLKDWSVFLDKVSKELPIPELDLYDRWSGKLDISGDSWQASGYGPGMAITAEMQHLVTKVLWSLFRTNYYFITSQALSIPYYPHSLRSPLLRHSIIKHAKFSLNGDPESYSDADEFRLSMFLMYRQEANLRRKDLWEFFGLSFSEITFPPVFLHVFNRASSIDDLISEAYNVRNSKPAISFRNKCQEMDACIENGDIKRLVSFKKEIKQVIDNIHKEYGIHERGKSNLKLAFGPLSFDFKQEIPSIMHKQYFPRKSYLAFLRNIYSDLICISRTGSIYDKLFHKVIE